MSYKKNCFPEMIKLFIVNRLKSHCRLSGTVTNLKLDDSKSTIQRNLRRMEQETNRINKLKRKEHVTFISTSQTKLRQSLKNKGEKEVEEIWQERVNDKEFLKEYADHMYKLANEHWNTRNENSRLTWLYDEIKDYFSNSETMTNKIEKEQRKIDFHTQFADVFKIAKEKLKESQLTDRVSSIKVLDVGSCYNPFGIYNDLDVTAIDLFPAVPEVKKCDFLKLKVVYSEEENKKEAEENKKEAEENKKEAEENKKEAEEENKKEANNKEAREGKRKLSESHSDDFLDKRKRFDSVGRNSNKLLIRNDDNLTSSDDIEIKLRNSLMEDKMCDTAESINELRANTFDAIVFSNFISYIPTPELRFLCFEKAYDLLKPNGILCLVTPDSRSIHSNVHIYKLWKVTLGFLGFQRLKYEKQSHFHGMVFRKGLCKDVWIIEAQREVIFMKDRNVKEKFKVINYDDVSHRIFIAGDFSFKKQTEVSQSILESFKSKIKTSLAAIKEKLSF